MAAQSTFISRLFGFKTEVKENCPIDGNHLVIGREAPLTLTYTCPKCGFFAIKFKGIKIPEIAGVEKEIIKPVEKVEEIKPPVTIKEKPEKPKIKLFKKPKPKVKETEEKIPEIKPKEEVPVKPEEREKIEIKPEIEEVKPKAEVRPEKIEIKPEVVETAKILKVPEATVKEAIEKIVEIEKRIPEKVTDVKEIEELKQMISQIEQSVRQERIIVIPQVIEELIAARGKISQLELAASMREPSKFSSIKNKIEELELKRQQMNEAKEIVKDKYYRGEIDENTLRNMMENYEQKLIEIEVELKHSKKQLEEMEKEGVEEVPEAYVPPVRVEHVPMGVKPPPIVRQPGISLMRPIKLPTEEPEISGEPRRKRAVLLPLPEVEKMPEEAKKVETSLDKIVQMVNEKGSVSISEISKSLGIKEEQVEEWSAILEEHGLVKISYPPIGKPVLRKIE